MSQAQIGVSRRTRWLTLAGVAAFHVALIAALIAAFGAEAVVSTVRSIAAFDVPVPPPPPPPPSPEPTEPEEQGRAAPPAPKATPKPAPPKPVVVVQPKPQPRASSAGASETSGAKAAGQGTGAGGQGDGTGSGGNGSGAGGGGTVRPPEKIAGELRTRDFPKSGAGERDGRFIIVRYTVGTDGRVSGCRVIQSSGSGEADAITCRLIEQRFRYRPALDAQGNPVARETGWKQWWWRPD